MHDQMITSEVLDQHQLIAYQKITAENGGISWMNVGDGKTRVGLLAARKIAWDYPVVVVIARRVAFYDWKLEIAALQLDVEIREMEDIAPTKVFNKGERFIILVSEGRVSSPFFKSFMDLHWTDIGCMIVDEGYLYKNPRSDKHEAVRPYAEEIPTVVLSGSIMTARDIVDIYGQVAIAGRAKVLAPTLTKFRSKFQMGIQGNFFTWHPKPTAYKEILQLIDPFTHIHMPDVRKIKEVTRKYTVLPTQQQRDYLKELKETAAIDGKFELTQMSNIVQKAQQISNGWIKRDDGDIEDFPSPKIERCLALVEELMQTDYKVVIWCAFRHDVARLILELHKAGYRDKQFTCWTSTDKFVPEKWNKKECRICIATEQMGSSVNHFAQVPYAIYFSQDFKFQSLQQSKGRHTRRSSEHSTAYFLFLHTEKSLDATVYWMVNSSMRSEKQFIRENEIMQWLKAA